MKKGQMTTGRVLTKVISAFFAMVALLIVADEATAATRFYLQNAAAPTFTATYRGTWTTSAAVSSIPMSTTKAGAVANRAVAETSATNPTSVLLIRAISDPIPAQTIAAGSTLTWAIAALENNAALNAAFKVHAYVTSGDGATVRGTLLNNNLETSEWATTAAGKVPAAAKSLTAVTAQANDRIVIEIGYNATNSVTTSYTGTLYYGGTGADMTDLGASTLTGWVEFSQNLLTPPVEQSLTLSAGNSTFVPAAFNINGTFDKTILTCDYTLNGGTNWVAATPSGTTCTAAISGQADGTNLAIQMRATSNGSGLSTVVNTLNRSVDASAPVTTTDYPGGTVSEDISVTLFGDDGSGSGIANIKYCQDTTNTCTPTTVYSAPVTLTGTANALTTKYLRYFSTDNVGLVETTKSLTVTIDKRIGTTLGTVSYPDVGYNALTVRFPFAGDNNVNNTCVIKWGTVNGTYPNTATAVRSASDYTATISGLSEATTYYFQATFADTDGLTGTNPVLSSQMTTTNTLLHNSANLGTAKFGTWGVTGSTTGAFTCATCHISNPSNANIKRIRPTVSASGTINGRSMVATNASVYGANNTTHTTSTNPCEVCHTSTAVHKYNQAAAVNHYGNDCVSCHKHTKSFAAPTDCVVCHDLNATASPTAPKVFDKSGATFNGSAYGTHLKALKTETLSSGMDWEAQCKKCHPFHSGGVTIANNTTVGINYATNGGIHLGGSATTKTTEAEICWECHANAANGVSEWGVNSDPSTGNSTYNYGTLSTPDWTTATWSSSRTQYAYKTGAIQSTHTANPAVTDANLSGAAYGYTETKNAVADIRCSYCHDVHELGMAASDKKEGQPYLRGSWMGNPYEEDGAPRRSYANTTYFATTAGFGQVPRGAITNYQKLGGAWIDQNNVKPMTATTAAQGTAAANPTATWEPLDTNAEAGNSGASSPAFAGLCLLCHGTGASTALKIDDLDQKTGESLWMGTNGHANSVKGGTGATSANSFNVFDARGASATLAAANAPYTHYDGGVMSWMTVSAASGPADDITATGFRSANTGALMYSPPLAASNTRPMMADAADNVWGTTIDATTKQNQYHKFSCSKCHNPHASRLPKLMITNCLDTQHNTWDNQFQLSTTHGAANTSKEIANWTSAQNCHRYSSISTGTAELDRTGSTGTQTATSMQGAGWNKVTPWKGTAATAP